MFIIITFEKEEASRGVVKIMYNFDEVYQYTANWSLQ